MIDLMDRLSGGYLVLGTMLSFFIGLPILIVRLMRLSRDSEDILPESDLKSATLVASFLLAGHVSVRTRTHPRKFFCLFNELRLFEAPQPGTVRVRFTVYRGIFAMLEETSFEVYGPAEDCEEFLRRGVSFSLKNGLLTAGGFLIPLVLYPTYWTQRRSIRRQVAAMSKQERRIWPPRPVYEEVEDPDEVFEVEPAPERDHSPQVLPWKSVILGALALCTLLAIATRYWVQIVNKDPSDFGVWVFLGGLSFVVTGGLAVSYAVQRTE